MRHPYLIFWCKLTLYFVFSVDKDLQIEASFIVRVSNLCYTFFSGTPYCSHPYFTLSFLLAPLVLLPFSSGIRCANPGTPSDGTRQLLDTVVGSMVTYSCRKGYRLLGDEQRTCQADTTWTGSLPVCQSKGLSTRSLQYVLTVLGSLLHCYTLSPVHHLLVSFCS